jgi:hypothetical protein
VNETDFKGGEYAPLFYAQISCPCASWIGGTRPLEVSAICCNTNEMKNTHLEHPEDAILTGDLDVLDWFTAAGTLSVKVDGAPAIVWGIDPACGEFFVGTKAVFNKKKIRIAHNHEEIDLFYQGEVARILHACFDCLPRTDAIIQGDFVGFGGACEYTPNTITYQFPEIVTQSVIIAPHTVYEANDDLRDSWALPLMLNLQSTDVCLFIKPEAYIQHGQRSFADVEEVVQFARQMSTAVNFVSDKEAAKIKQQLNACIREQRVINPEDFDCDRLLIEFWLLVKSIKEDCVFLCRNDGPAAYIGQNRIDAEGYVLSNEFGMFKLVNREVFSHANFNSGRFQCAS